MELNNTTDFLDVNETSPELEPEVDFIFEFLVPSVFLNGVGILGLVGNLLSIFILSRPQMKGSTNCILIGLATYDSILILSRFGPALSFVLAQMSRASLFRLLSYIGQWM